MRAGPSAGAEPELLGDYRTRLVTDVVTGKLDVREAAAQLPDDVEEAELLDEADTHANDEDTLDSAPEEAEA